MTQAGRTDYTAGTILRGWQPDGREHPEPQSVYLVDCNAQPDLPHDFTDLQAAIDVAIGRAEPALIRVQPGFYPGPVYIPASAPPLTIEGAGSRHVTIAAAIDAQMPGQVYRAQFGHRFAKTHPDSRAIFEQICARQRLTTGNTAVLRVEAADTRLSGITIRNVYACDRTEAAPDGALPDVEGRFAHGQHQAVALHLAGADRVSLRDLRLSSYQDTLYLQARAGQPVLRCHLADCLIEGDVDFIFGAATALFEDCEIRSRGERGVAGWVTAPSTDLRTSYGFVFSACRFTHDGTEAGADGCTKLGRQWFEGVRATPYDVPDIAGYRCTLAQRSDLQPPVGTISRRSLEAVGKCAVINCELGPHIDLSAPWDSWGGPEWSPRYRPVQTGMQSFLGHLGGWLALQNLDYSDVDPDDIWLDILSG